jgi:L-alanine-DL-glutamate epimerase-like enolase superfamily enzyme
MFENRLKALFKKHMLQFKRPAGTSRGALTSKQSFFIIVQDEENPGVYGIGEAGILPGLSIDNPIELEAMLNEVCRNINDFQSYLETGLRKFPAIRFGLETALIDLNGSGKRILFPSGFTKGKGSIEINGLVWMGEFDFMRQQIVEKIESGFSCLKLKIGAIGFDEEIELIKSIRKEFSEKDIEIRVDANGAFLKEDAPDKLKILSEYKLHSIEQPIKQGQWQEMAKLCEISPLPIALDEELIGIATKDEKRQLLEAIKPQYIILKPGLIGGFQQSEEWIELVKENNTGWWVTSALESNIGLNAIAQWTYNLGNKMPQGLGTGQLYVNNFESPLAIETGRLHYKPGQNWDLRDLI